MIKYAANAFLATKVGFANEIANICERVGADGKKVMVGISMDSRIGSSFLGAGRGVASLVASPPGGKLAVHSIPVPERADRRCDAARAWKFPSAISFRICFSTAKSAIAPELHALPPWRSRNHWGWRPALRLYPS